MSWVARFQAIPFADDGRDWRGCDCWGLHRLIVKERLGLDLPAWDTVATTDLEQVARTVDDQLVAGCWRRVETADAVECDLVLMREAGEAVHVGTYLEGDRVIHTQRLIGAAVVGLDHPRLPRVEGIYRYVQ